MLGGEVMDNPVEVGKFGAVFGTNGWIKVHSFTEQLESIFEYLPWYIKDQGKWCEVQIEEWKHHGNGLIVKLVGIDQREIAQQKTNYSIYVDESVLPELPEGEFYLNDLYGVEVYNEQNYKLGKITDFFETGANRVLVLKADKDDQYGKKERLIPLVFGDIIKDFDNTKKTMVVVWDPDF